MSEWDGGNLARHIGRFLLHSDPNRAFVSIRLKNVG
jgi:hypothetical protein